jgi:small GTP-binding protein
LEPTIEDSNRKHLTVDGKSCTVEVLDTSGYDCYADSIPGWISNNDGFLLVYSIGSQASFARIFTLLKLVRETAPKGPIVLVGSKCDDATVRQVKLGESHTLATENGCGFFETSARTGLNVEDAFSDLVRTLRGATIKGVTLVADSAGQEGCSWPVALWDGVLACLRGCCSPRKLTAGGLRKSRAALKC